MTYTTKHTPGPWVVRNMSDAMAEKFTVERLSDNGLRSVICRINDMEVCPEHGGTGSDANAALIAAAPAMYAQLVYILGRLHAHENGEYTDAQLHSDMERIDRTLTQAEGKHD